MVLNKRGGNKSRRQKRGGTQNHGRALRTRDKQPDSCELYAKVVKRLGGNPPQIMVLCEDGHERNCVVRGKMCKRVWMNPNDFVIILYNKESNELRGEIEYKYEASEISKLEKQGEIVLSKFNVSSELYSKEVDDNIVFGEEDDDELDQTAIPESKGLADLDNDNFEEDLDDDFNIEDI